MEQPEQLASLFTRPIYIACTAECRALGEMFEQSLHDLGFRPSLRVLVHPTDLFPVMDEIQRSGAGVMMYNPAHPLTAWQRHQIYCMHMHQFFWPSTYPIVTLPCSEHAPLPLLASFPVLGKIHEMTDSSIMGQAFCGFLHQFLQTGQRLRGLPSDEDLLPFFHELYRPFKTIPEPRVYFEQLTYRYPQSVDAWVAFTGAASKTEDVFSLRTACAQLSTLPATETLVLFNKMREAEMQGQWENMEADASLLWSNHQELLDGPFYRCVALRELQRFEDLRITLNWLLQRDPLWAPAFLEQGIFAQTQQAHHAAIRLFQRALKYGASIEGTQTSLAISYEALGDFVAEEASLRAALQDAQQNWFAHQNLGLFLIKHNRWEEAQQYFHQGLDLDSAQPVLWFYLGLCQYNLGLMIEARSSFLRASTLDPDAPYIQEALDNLFP
jgi:tetratricopeptide (TPR) repeat protein